MVTAHIDLDFTKENKMIECQIDNEGNIYLGDKKIGKRYSDRYQEFYATEDGSVGYRGTVVDLLLELSDKQKGADGQT